MLTEKKSEEQIKEEEDEDASRHSGELKNEFIKEVYDEESNHEELQLFVIQARDLD